MSYQERLRPGEVVLQEAINGCLPSIDVLKHDYADASAGLVGAERATALLELTRLYEPYAQADVLECSDVPEQDMASALFLEMVKATTWQKLANRHSGRNRHHDSAYEESIMELIAAKHQFQEHLDNFLVLVDGAPEPKILDALEAIVYEARCLAGDKADLEGAERPENMSMLIGILAEYKVMSALRGSDWPDARYGSPDEDFRFGADIVIPIGGWNERQSLTFEVKTRHGRGRGLVIEQVTPTHWIVRVPMFSGKNSQLSLAPDEARHLERALRRESRVIIAGSRIQSQAV